MTEEKYNSKKYNSKKYIKPEVKLDENHFEIDEAYSSAAIPAFTPAITPAASAGATVAAAALAKWCSVLKR